jgi:hypothetical protein
MTHGTLTLLTPLHPSLPSDWPPSALVKDGPRAGELRETVVNVGEIVVQRGTLVPLFRLRVSSD